MALDGKVGNIDLYGNTPPKGVNPTENKGIEPMMMPVREMNEVNNPSPDYSDGRIPRGQVGSGIDK